MFLWSYSTLDWFKTQQSLKKLKMIKKNLHTSVDVCILTLANISNVWCEVKTSQFKVVGWCKADVSSVVRSGSKISELIQCCRKALNEWDTLTYNQSQNTNRDVIIMDHLKWIISCTKSLYIKFLLWAGRYDHRVKFRFICKTWNKS